MSKLIFLLAVTSAIAVGQATPARTCEQSAGTGHWSCYRAIPGKTCVKIEETSDPHTWGDNYFCTDSDIGLKWSLHDPIRGMRCTQIFEEEEPARHMWMDNWLCLPRGSPWWLSWSTSGPIAGRDCVQWLEPSDVHSWTDNFLCLDK